MDSTGTKSQQTLQETQIARLSWRPSLAGAVSPDLLPPCPKHSLRSASLASMFYRLMVPVSLAQPRGVGKVPRALGYLTYD